MTRRAPVQRPCTLPGCTLDHRHQGAHHVEIGARLIAVERSDADPVRPVGRPRTRPIVVRRSARGRPVTVPDPVSLTVRITACQRATLDEVADRDGVSIGAVVRGAIERL